MSVAAAVSGASPGRAAGSGREQQVREPIELDLDCGLLRFEDGEWTLVSADGAGGGGGGGGGSNAKDVSDLRRKVATLEEENNMLKYKMEVLIDMLAVAELDRKKMEDKLERRGVASGSKPGA